MSTALTVPMTEFNAIVAVAAHAAPTDDGAPVALQSLQFTVGGGSVHLPHFQHRTFASHSPAGNALSVAATDRFRLAWATTYCTMEEGEPAEVFMLRADDVRAMIRSFPAQGSGRKRMRHTVAINVLEGSVRFTVKRGVDYEQTTVLPRQDVSKYALNFPALSKVVHFGTVSPQPDEYAVNPTYASDMYLAMNKVRRYREPVSVSASGPHKPIRFSLPNDGPVMASGMLMPVKDGGA